MRFLALSEQQSEPPQLKHWGQQQQQSLQHRLKTGSLTGHALEGQ